MVVHRDHTRVGRRADCLRPVVVVRLRAVAGLPRVVGGCGDGARSGMRSWCCVWGMAVSDLSTYRSAIISDDGAYRYRLERFWSGEPALPFVMLNPSTADAAVDDPTIRRCMGFARREQAGGIIVCNLYAFRATEPSILWRASDPYGPENDRALVDLASWAHSADMPIVCGWGAHGGNSNRPVVLMQQTGVRLVCLGRTKGGQPRHPLYVRGDQPLEAYP